MIRIDERWQTWLRTRFPIYALIGFASLSIADLSILSTQEHMIPDTAPPPRPAGRGPRGVSVDVAEYGVISDRNIFNSDGLIADPVGGVSDEIDEDSAVPSNLPIKLVATIVSNDPERSIAAFHLQNAPGPQVFRVGQEIGDQAEVVRIKRGRVFLRSTASQRLEYLELPIESPIQLGGEFGVVAEGIVRQSEQDFSVERAKLDNYTANLPELLQQARAVPQVGAGGTLQGFRLAAVQPGSIFEKLGLKVGDVIKSVNGQKIDNAAKAMELYNSLKGEAAIELEIDRAGQSKVFNYSVR